MSDESQSLSKKRRKHSDCHCHCISHEFFRVASNHPNKVAVVHSQISTQLRTSGIVDNTDTDKPPLSVKSASPPFYDGDRRFTFSDLLTSVDSLTSRLRSILLGNDLIFFFFFLNFENFVFIMKIHSVDRNKNFERT